MKQEDRELLLQDLCARLPYGVKCKWEHEYDGNTYTGGGILYDIDHVKTPNGYRYWDCYFEDEGEDIPIELIKPYLRSMSSMTEEEKKKLGEISCEGNIEHKYGIFYRSQDYLNSIHVDYRGLIEKGLALEAPKDMYNIK